MNDDVIKIGLTAVQTTDRHLVVIVRRKTDMAKKEQHSNVCHTSAPFRILYSFIIFFIAFKGHNEPRENVIWWLVVLVAP